jgi:hypothetical protein
MGAANVDPAPLIVDEPDGEAPFDEVLHAAPVRTTAAAAMTAAVLRVACAACTILMMAPPSQTFRPGPA